MFFIYDNSMQYFFQFHLKVNPSKLFIVQVNVSEAKEFDPGAHWDCSSDEEDKDESGESVYETEDEDDQDDENDSAEESEQFTVAK